jgi:RNA polymerase sigma factor (sigma-70 family)
MDPTVDVGPVIQRKEVDRIDEWVKEAVSQGATVLTGGEGDTPFYQPTLIADVRPEMKVCREEIFGPVVTISPYQTFEDLKGKKIATPSAVSSTIVWGMFIKDWYGLDFCIERPDGSDCADYEVIEGDHFANMELLLRGDIEAALTRLPPDFRTAVVLCDVQGLSYEEIAEATGWPLGTVRSRIHRGRKLLRGELEPTEGDDA